MKAPVTTGRKSTDTDNYTRVTNGPRIQDISI